MSDNDDYIKNLISKSKSLAPRRCASTTGIAALNCFPNLAIREARSCSGTMTDLRYTESDKQNEQISAVRHYGEHECEGDEKTGIPTVNKITNEPYYVKDSLLMHNGKKYTQNDIALRWKKDCRKWLWKSSNSKTKL